MFSRLRLSLNDKKLSAPDNQNGVRLTFIGKGGHLRAFVTTELLLRDKAREVSVHVANQHC
ncbi:hypothetical protein KVMX100_120755 [Klebsiella variicola]|nr:hypothetical protein KVMX100_120755 [Klebsiella variicola]